MYGTPKHKIDSLILDYFIQEGYEEAAINFSRETGILLERNPYITGEEGFPPLLKQVGTSSDEEFAEIIHKYMLNENGQASRFNSTHSTFLEGDSSQRTTRSSSHLIAPNLILQGYTTIRQRKEIKFLILKGQITEAIQKISEYCSTVLDRNNLLYFKLLRLNLIEMIRNHKLDQQVTNEKEKIFLNDILTFVRENLINKVVHLQKLLKELEITMSLLCFNFDPAIKNIEEQKDLPEELRKLFNLSLRKKCNGLVNRAILNLSYGEIAGGVSSVGRSNGQNEIEVQQIKQLQAELSKNGVAKVEMGSVAQNDDIDSVKKTEVQQISDFGEEDGTMDEQNTEKLNMESKLEKIIKLWIVTEQRLMELNIFDTKRLNADDILI